MKRYVYFANTGMHRQNIFTCSLIQRNIIKQQELRENAISLHRCYDFSRHVTFSFCHVTDAAALVHTKNQNKAKQKLSKLYDWKNILGKDIFL